MKNILIIIYLLGFTTAFGQTNTWTGSAGDNDWFNSGNWDLNVVPTSAHDVVIKNGDEVQVNMSGAVANTVSLELDGSFNHLYLASGADLTASTMMLSYGQLKGLGTFNGDVTTQSGGIVTPGDITNNIMGTLTINGNYTQDNSGGSGGYLYIFVRGTGTGEFSILSVSGTATLSEELFLQVFYSSNINDNIVFLTSNTLSGTFNNTNLNTWNITYDDPATGDVKATFDPPVPSNDACANAISMTSGMGYNGYTSNAVPGVTPTPSCYSSGQYDIWYSLVAPASGTILIHQFNPNDISALALYAGTCGGLSETACMESMSNGNSCPQLLVEGLTSGNTYYLQVITDGQQSNVSFDYSESTGGPSNDFCTGAIAASVGAIDNCPTGQISGTTVNANHTSAVSCNNEYQCNWVDVYYTITTPASGNVKFIPGTGTPAATFYSGSCGALVSEACLTAEGNASLTGNATYFVKISTFDDNNNYPDGEGKAFTFCLEEGPPTNTWTGSAGDHDWFNSGNWGLNVVPTSAHHVVIQNGDQVQVNMSGAVANVVLLEGGSYSQLFLASGADLTASTMNQLVVHPMIFVQVR